MSVADTLNSEGTSTCIDGYRPGHERGGCVEWIDGDDDDDECRSYGLMAKRTLGRTMRR